MMGSNTSGKAQICVVSQPRLTSGLGGYLLDAYGRAGHPTALVNCREDFWARACPALISFHPNRDIWYRRRWEKGLFSPAAWDRHTRINGRMLDRVLQPGGKILQVGKEYFPHPRYKDLEYFVFINYNAKLSAADGVTPWVPARQDEAGFFAREEELYRQARHVFTCGEYLKRSLVQDYGVDPARVTAVGNGVDPTFLQLPPPQPFAERFSRQLLFVGWDFGMKGGADLLQAMPIIRARHPGVELLVVGPDEAQRDRQGPAAQAEGIRWIGPLRDRARLLEHFRTADLFVMPSLRDSYGFVFLEAMSQGLPCLGADINGMPEIIADGQTGYVVPLRDPERLAAAVIRYYDDPANKRRMAEATLARLHAHFTWERVLEKMRGPMGL